MKKIIIILDGLGDLPEKELGGKTPLEAAKTPNMDFLAKWGETGLMYPIKKGWAPESDQSMISMLGFNPFRTYTGRGVLEAYGSGIDFKGKVVCRCNFSRINKQGNILAIQGATEKQSKNFIKILNKLKENVKLVHTVGYRCVMLIDTKSSPKVTNTHPGYVITKNFCSQAQPIAGRILKVRKCKPLVKSAKETANIINAFISLSKKYLKYYELITRGTGNKLPKLSKLKGKWALLADMPVEKAIGKLVGMTVLPKYLNLNKTLDVIKKNFNRFDNFYLQVKGPDMYGHLGMCKEKVKSIEKIDKEFISKIKDLPFDVICVTADHSTPCSIKAHSEHPTPILIYGKDRDSVRKFSEKACKEGSLGYFDGRKLLKLI
ncbi:MAG: alkaline phosphatase family protein [Nanoarchaeota archaeon]|nr:alkaline phosphatase family protein [Nanoarchaeota archaeon]